MNVLTDRNLKDYTLEGQVKVNGVAIGKGIKHISAYVQQDDLFFSTLTVKETLTFRVRFLYLQTYTNPLFDTHYFNTQGSRMA